MSNLFLNIPVPAGNGTGAPVETSQMASTKTVLCGGPFVATVNLEISNDAGAAVWAPLATFQRSGNVTVSVSARFMRARVSDYKSGVANIDVGAAMIGDASFVLIPGNGTAVDISAAPLLKTVIAPSSFAGNVEISGDGISYAQIWSFQDGGQQSREVVGKFARAIGSGEDVYLGATTDDTASAEPPQPPFAPVDIFIYARIFGDDATGTGSLTNPYKTIERAVRDVPTLVPAGVVYHVDGTGTGLQPLPDMYEFPVFVVSESIGDFEFDERFFYYYGSVNITADPQLATGVTGFTTIPSAAGTGGGPVVVGFDPTTALIELQVPVAGWTPGELKGKFLIGAGPSTEHCVICYNTADTLYLTKVMAFPPPALTPTFPMTYPLEIMECSAHLQAGKDPTRLHRGAVNLINSSAVLGGLKISSTELPDGAFSNWGLQVGGTVPSTALMLCDLPGCGLVGESWIRLRACYLPGLLFAMAPLSWNSVFVDESIVVGGTTQLTVWGARGLDSFIKNSVIRRTTPLFFRDLFDQFNGGAVGLLDVQNTLFVDMLPNFAPPTANDMDGPINSAIYWTGGQLYLMRVDFKNTSLDPLISPAIVPILNATNAVITVAGNGSHAQLRSVTSSGVSVYPGVGAAAIDGGFIVQNDVPNASAFFVPVGPATTVAGTAGAFQSGSNAIAATWAAGLPAPGAADPDFVDQGTRISRKS